MGRFFGGGYLRREWRRAWLPANELDRRLRTGFFARGRREIVESETLLAAAPELQINFSEDARIDKRAVSAWTFARGKIEAVTVKLKPLRQRIQ